jgi:hypothetical protein
LPKFISSTSKSDHAPLKECLQFAQRERPRGAARVPPRQRVAVVLIDHAVTDAILAAAGVDAGDILRCRGDREARDRHLVLQKIRQVLAAHEGRVDSSQHLSIFVAERRLRLILWNLIEPPGIYQSLQRRLAFGCDRS